MAPTRGARGRGRGASAGKRGASSGARGAKRPAPEEDSDYDGATASSDSQPKKRSRVATDKPAKPPLEPRAPSTRSTKVLNPGKPDQPKEIRSTAEMDVIRAELAQSLAQQERERAAILQRIADLDADADEAAEEEQRDAILTLDDLPPGDENEDAMDEDGPGLVITESDFERVDDDMAHRSPEPFAAAPKKPKVKTTTAKKIKKLGRGETRAAIEALAVKTRERKGKGKQTRQNVDGAAASKRAGLSKAFLAGSAQGLPPDITPESPKLGGLTDEHAAAARPDFAATKAPKSRVNEFIDISVSSDTDETPTKAATRPFAKPRAVKTESKIPALKVPKTTPKVTVETASSFDPFTPHTSSDVKGLPALIGPTWDSHFIPTANRALYCSLDPIMFAAKGETDHSKLAAVAAIQRILDVLFPGNTLVLVWGDKICSRIVSRMRERRSLIGLTALRIVRMFFEAPLYKDQPIATRAYATYALRPDGPGFWRIPTPEHIPCDPKFARYIKGVDYLQSEFILQTVAPFLATGEFPFPQADNMGKYDFTGIMPCGLYAMAAAAVQRAFSLYTATGVISAKIPKFNRRSWGGAVGCYTRNINGFTLSRWTSLLTAGGGLPGSTAAPAAVPAMQDSIRDSIYIASSP